MPPDPHSPDPIRGRGASSNPTDRFSTVRLEILGEHREHQRLCGEPTRRPETVITPDHAKSVINRVDSPDVPFGWSLNPYRGCEHGCFYCYARPTHEYFNLSCGLDFETKIFAKHDAPDLLRKALLAPSWKGEPLTLSGVTDPYQPAERELEITRACIRVCAEFRQSVGIITKNAMVTRDLDLFADLARQRLTRVAISLTTLDNALAAAMEPRASAPQARLRAMRELADAGVPVTVMTAPIIPGLNDHELPALLEAARDAGASSAGFVLLRLPHQLKTLFTEWLAAHAPDRAAHVESLLRQCRDGELNQPQFGTRMRGSGPLAAQIRQTFDVFSARLGLNAARPSYDTSLFRRPGDGPTLWG